MPDNDASDLQNIRNYYELIDAKRLFPEMDNKQIAGMIGMAVPTMYRALKELAKEDVLNSSYSINPDYASFLGISIGASICKVVIISMDFRMLNNERINDYLLSVGKELKNKLSEEKILSREESSEEKKKKTLIEECLRKIKSGEKTYLYFDTPQVFSNLKNCIDFIISEALKDEYSFSIKGIGISTTGLVDQIRNEIVTASNLKYLEKQDINTLLYPELDRQLKAKNIKISLIQNTNASLLADKIYLYQKEEKISMPAEGENSVQIEGENSVQEKKGTDILDSKNMASLYLGVGLGVGLCLNGRLYYGSNGYAGEIGHIPALEFETKLSDYDKTKYESIGDTICTCGRPSCYDHKIRKYVFQSTASDFKEFSTDKIAADLTPNTPEKKERLKLLGQYLGGIISYLINTLNLDLIVLSGKLYKMDIELLDYINMALDDYCITASRKNCKIIKSKIGTLSAAYGAAVYSYYDHYDITPDWNWKIN